jgi:hypothetical protein
MHMREGALGGAAAFGLNWVWENAQAPLYKGYAGFAQDVQMCTVATLGDVAIVAVIWATVALSWRDSTWHRHPSFARYGAAVVGYAWRSRSNIGRSRPTAGRMRACRWSLTRK